MASERTILITAASGNNGQHLIPLLLSRNPAPKLILPTSSADKLRSALSHSVSTNALDGTVIAEGSLRDPVWLESLLKAHSVDTVFLSLTGTDEMYTALNALDSISNVGSVTRVVYMSIMGDFTSPEGVKTFLRERSYAHVYAKLVVEQKLLYGRFGFEWTVLGGSWFFSNFERFRVPLVEMGVLPGPLFSKGVCSVSNEDIALAAANAMLDQEGKWVGKKIQLGSKHAYTGADLVRIWSDALGRQVETYWADEAGLQRVETEFRKLVPGDNGTLMARNFKLLSEYLERNGLEMKDRDYQAFVELLGREPQDFEVWAKNTMARWRE